MPDITVTIRDTDLELLEEIAEREWRDTRQQASALLEQVLSAHRARANGVGKPHVNGARRGARIPVAPA